MEYDNDQVHSFHLHEHLKNFLFRNFRFLEKLQKCLNSCVPVVLNRGDFAPFVKHLAMTGGVFNYHNLGWVQRS